MDIFTTVITVNAKLYRAIVRTDNRDKAARLLGVPLKDTNRTIGHAANIKEIEVLEGRTHEVWIRPHLEEDAVWTKLERRSDAW